MFFDLLTTRGGGYARGHDEGHVRRGLTQRFQHHAKRGFELDGEGFGVGGFPSVYSFDHHTAKAVAAGPALKRCHHVFAGNRLAIMKLQPVAQGESP